MGDAFDAAWAEIGHSFQPYPQTIEDARMALAHAVISVSREGVCDVDFLKTAALEAMAKQYRTGNG